LIWGSVCALDTTDIDGSTFAYAHLFNRPAAIEEATGRVVGGRVLVKRRVLRRGGGRRVARRMEQGQLASHAIVPEPAANEAPPPMARAGGRQQRLRRSAPSTAPDEWDSDSEELFDPRHAASPPSAG